MKEKQPEFRILIRPLKFQELQEKATKDQCIAVVLDIDLAHLIDNDLEDFDNLADERIVGNDCCGHLTQLSYTVVGIKGDAGDKGTIGLCATGAGPITTFPSCPIGKTKFCARPVTRPMGGVNSGSSSHL